MNFTVSKILTTRGGFHSIRSTIRLVFLYDGKWLVFRGPLQCYCCPMCVDCTMYHFSSDGVHWTRQVIPEFGSRSFLIRGNTIYSFAFAPTMPFLFHQHREGGVQGTIQDETIRWGKPTYVPSLKIYYYPDLQQDSTGRFTVSGRVTHFNDAGKVSNATVEWVRSLHPNDITAWSQQQQVIHHSSDMKSGASHKNIPLENGKSFVIGMLSVNGQVRLYGNLFDGEKWGEEDTLLAENMSSVRGTDKRMSAVWDPKQRTIHMTYVDHDSNLWYRTCPSPYRSQDWSSPVKLKKFKVFTNILSLDTTKTTTNIWLLYGKTLFEHPDPRWQSGELYVEKFDGESWGESVLVSESGTKYNLYPNMNEDVSKGIGVMYLKGMPKNQAAIKKTDFDQMFSSTKVIS